jgi:hypothetical protein
MSEDKKTASKKTMAELLTQSRELPDDMPDLGEEVILLWQDPQLLGAIIPMLLKVIGMDPETGKCWGWAWTDPTMVFETETGEKISPPPLMPVQQSWYNSKGKANHWFYLEEYGDYVDSSMESFAKMVAAAQRGKDEADAAKGEKHE